MNKLLVGLLVSVGCISANAANWAISAESVSKNGTILMSYIDTDSVIYMDRTYQTRSVWIKTYYTNNTYSLMRQVVHCPTKMYYTQVEHIYSSNTLTFLYTSIYTPNNYNIQYEYSIPGSIGEIWSNQICRINTTGQY